MKTGYNNLSYFENLQITTYGGNDMKGHMNTDLGQITIDSDVIAAYAGSVAMEVFGIVGMAAISVKDGVFKLLKKESLRRGVHATVTDNKISLEFHVIVAYGVSISAVADNLMDSVKHKVEGFTGMEVEHIDVLVEGIRVID